MKEYTTIVQQAGEFYEFAINDNGDNFDLYGQPITNQQLITLEEHNYLIYCRPSRKGKSKNRLTQFQIMYGEKRKRKFEVIDIHPPAVGLSHAILQELANIKTYLEKIDFGTEKALALVFLEQVN